MIHIMIFYFIRINGSIVLHLQKLKVQYKFFFYILIPLVTLNFIFAPLIDLLESAY